MLIRMITRGRIVIPLPIRQKLGITAGTRLQVIDEEDRIVIEPIRYDHRKMQRGRKNPGRQEVTHAP
jgi:AbrB family looped-hinge helix DNA binding protein